MIGRRWMIRGIVNDWRESVRCKGEVKVSQRKGKHVQSMNCDLLVDHMHRGFEDGLV